MRPRPDAKRKCIFRPGGDGDRRDPRCARSRHLPERSEVSRPGARACPGGSHTGLMRTAIPVNFTLDLNGRTGPRSGQVARALIDAIACGQVHDGDRLPSTRTLAATFGLARTAVVAAYEELTAAGFLVARPGGFTFVKDGAGAAARAGAFGVSLPPPAPASPRPVSPITYD